nr:iron chelate uptake ABC transporter family permease subunit [Demetria terragena]
MTTRDSTEPTPGSVESPSFGGRRAIGLLVIGAALFVAFILSLAHGANPLSYSDVWSALWSRGDNSTESIIVWSERWPRTLVGIMVGAALGVAGALIQALTRNPLADPGILGVNAGAGFAVTIGIGIFGLTSVSQYIWVAFLGAAVATVAVFAIGSVGGGGTASPITLVLAGVALGAVLTGIETFFTLLDPETFRGVRNWTVGSLARATLADAGLVAPFIIVGLLIALALATSLNSIALGDDLAASLGTNVRRVRVFGVIALTLLAGGATALTGGIAFVGLMVPHVVRWFVGPDQRWIMAYSLLAAPAFVLIADVVGRVIARPGEIEVWIVTAVLGAPVLIALVRRRDVSAL